MSDLVCREVTWRDIEELVALDARLFEHEAWPAPTWWAELAGRPRRDYLVAEDGEGITAYAGLDHGGDVSDVMTIAVAPRAQGRGLGRSLLSELVGRSRGRGAEALMLEVRADNDPACALYSHHGFEVIQTRRGYYQPGGVDALVMRRMLTEVQS